MRRGLQLALLSVALVLTFPGSAMGEFAPLDRFGEFGAGAGQLSSPAGAEVSADGELFVADSGNDRIAIFAGDGTFARTLIGGLSGPRDVALDGDGRVFVADTGNNRVAVLSTAGALLPGFESSGEAELSGPTGVAVGGSSVFVADTGKSRIAVFEEDGEFLSSFATLTPPKDVAVGPGGNLFVVGDEQVDVYTPAGLLIDSFGDEPGEGKLEKPAALALGREQVFVAEQGEDMVERFSSSGAYLGGFSVESTPGGVATACGGNVFAIEEEMNFARIARFGEPGAPPPPCAEPPGEPVQVTFVRVPSNKFRFAGLVKNRSNGYAVLFVRVPGPGRVILKGRGVRRLARGAQGPMRVRLPIKPKVRLRHFLKRHGKGRIRVEVTFRPVGGEPFTREKPILLKRKRR
jgi:sugar lactone lactonase YvrE